MAEDAFPKTLIVIVGPTAVGKTAVAIRVAEALSAPIVSADSRQIFRELEIGTAKPSEAELRMVPHHFINSHSIHENYDAAAYGEDALQLLEELFASNQCVVLCGGSGLYIRAILEGFDDIPEIDPAIRRELDTGYREYGIGWLQQKMVEHDAEHLQTIDRQNPQRLMRALEVKIGTGFSIRHFQMKQSPRALPFRVIRIGLDLPREELYKRIDRRMDEMISAGLFAEAARFFPLRHLNALQTVGYREIFDFMEGKTDHDEAVRLLKRNSRRYAKRQLTWFRKDHAVTWFNPAAVDSIIAFVRSRSAAEAGVENNKRPES